MGARLGLGWQPAVRRHQRTRAAAVRLVDARSLLPPGATVEALRGTAFLDGAGTTGPILLLLSWIAVSLALAAVGTWTARRRRVDQPRPGASVAALQSA